MCLGALGSQTGGSLTRPASYCGIATCKPSYGLLPVDGVVPLAASMDHPGPMGRCVQDVAVLLSGMGPRALYDISTNYPAAALPSDEPPAILRARGLFEERAEPSVRRMMDETCHTLEERGVEIVEHALPPEFAEVISRHRIVMAVEAAVFHEVRLRRHPEDYAPRIRALLEEGLACPAPEYARTKEHQVALKDAFGTAVRGRVLITPATTGPAPAADTTGDPAFNSPWSYTGLPTISFPTGDLADGLPLAIQLVAGLQYEAELFAAAAWCEQALGVKPLNPPAK